MSSTRLIPKYPALGGKIHCYPVGGGALGGHKANCWRQITVQNSQCDNLKWTTPKGKQKQSSHVAPLQVPVIKHGPMTPKSLLLLWSTSMVKMVLRQYEWSTQLGLTTVFPSIPVW